LTAQLIEAWASLKSFKPKDYLSEGGADPSGGGRNRPADFCGKKRSNETHCSTTDPDARLYRKGPGMEAKLCFIRRGLMENRSGLIIDARLTRVSGHAERLAAREMVQNVADHPCAITLGADRGVRRRRFRRGIAHAQCAPSRRAEHQQAALGDRQADNAASRLWQSQRVRKRIEEAFGWIKTVAGFPKNPLRSLAKVDWAFTFCRCCLQPGASWRSRRHRRTRIRRRIISFH
jgi:hypothetical protein